MKISSCLGLVLTTGLAVACGGDTTSAFNSDASTGGAPGGGASGSAGTSGSGGAGAGGGAAGGASGAGGAITPPGDAGACPPPVDPARSVVCVTLLPEAITPHPNDPELDEKGTLVVQLFDTPTPAKGAKGLDEVTLPLDPLSGKEVSLDLLPTIRLAAKLNGTAYVRALFVDSKKSFHGDQLDYGAWVGGLDLSKGVRDNMQLDAIPAAAGTGTSVNIAMSAFRKLTVTVHRAVPPVAGGDSQGPVAFIAVDTADVAKNPNGFGFGSIPCADLSTKDATVTGFVIGGGPYWVLGSLNDLGLPGTLPPGEFASLDVSISPPTYKIPTKLDVPSTAYALSTTVNLSFVVPRSLDAGEPPPNSCADLLPPGDGGVDAGP